MRFFCGTIFLEQFSPLRPVFEYKKFIQNEPHSEEKYAMEQQRQLGIEGEPCDEECRKKADEPDESVYIHMPLP